MSSGGEAPERREHLVPLRLALEGAAEAVDRAVVCFVEPGVADAAVSAGVDPLLGVDCMWWVQQLRTSARLLERASNG